MTDSEGPLSQPLMRVLVVDDEANLRFAIARRLRNANIDAAVASTVRQAIERLRSEAFDVVLCDLRMPGGDGTQLLQWLGSVTPSTKAVILSAYVTPQLRTTYEDAGLPILEKPIDLDVLVEKLFEFGPRRGFFGNSLEVELFDYVQMIALSGRDKVIEVRTHKDSGLIWFDHGDIVHVQYQRYRGEEAFYKLLAINRGTFSERLYQAPPMRTVTRSSTHLLMEAARQADEGILGLATNDDDDEGMVVITDGQVSGDIESGTFATLGDDGRGLEVGEDLVLPADHDPTGEFEDAREAPTPFGGVFDGAGDDHAEALGSDLAASAMEVPFESTGHVAHAYDDPETRRMLLAEFRQFDGVDGVALISSTGKVLVDDFAAGSSSALLTLAGFYLRGAARLARTLGYNVFDGVVARSQDGQQMLMVSMGATSAVLSIARGYDPEAIRDQIMGEQA